MVIYNRLRRRSKDQNNPKGSETFCYPQLEGSPKAVKHTNKYHRLFTVRNSRVRPKLSNK